MSNKLKTIFDFNPGEKHYFITDKRSHEHCDLFSFSNYSFRTIINISTWVCIRKQISDSMCQNITFMDIETQKEETFERGQEYLPLIQATMFDRCVLSEFRRICDFILTSKIALSGEEVYEQVICHKNFGYLVKLLVLLKHKYNKEIFISPLTHLNQLSVSIDDPDNWDRYAFRLSMLDLIGDPMFVDTIRAHLHL